MAFLGSFKDFFGCNEHGLFFVLVCMKYHRQIKLFDVSFLQMINKVFGFPR